MDKKDYNIVLQTELSAQEVLEIIECNIKNRSGIGLISNIYESEYFHGYVKFERFNVHRDYIFQSRFCAEINGIVEEDAEGTKVYIKISDPFYLLLLIYVLFIVAVFKALSWFALVFVIVLAFPLYGMKNSARYTLEHLMQLVKAEHIDTKNS